MIKVIWTSNRPRLSVGEQSVDGDRPSFLFIETFLDF